ncbi:tubulin domain-domain-containing protein [Leucosporidium creatinivorum]|uniref:Tubulin domain-domain-containing protein n=1 Tax=Leucosporidium creatinivorum TaxID=106004 RepID=A0A1Y2FXW2_9BASI|nr:tubulin domain-domain-containing protein [Leucosporidium creatinivorum]
MEAVLVSRNPGTDQHGILTTADYTLHLSLGGEPESEWPGSSKAGSHPSVQQDSLPTDLYTKPRALAGFSSFGSGETNEFATWIQGREAFLSNPKLREGCEDDMRSFAERSDHTEGFMLSSPISDGFSGFTSIFLETLRDEFPKNSIFTTAMLSDALGWKREDTERSKNQRLLNAALSMQHFEELSSMVLPIQPPSAWEDKAPWTKFLRDDVPRPEAYSFVLNAHLQSANSELREPDSLNSIITQLNWRGDNKICHLTGSTPLLPPHLLGGAAGQQALKESLKDFSVFSQPRTDEDKALGKKERRSEPFAQYSVVRGYETEETQALGPILEASTPLKEPLSTWICLPHPYPLTPTSPPIFRSLLPTGRPLILAPPPNYDPYSPQGLFGLPDPLFLHTQSHYFVQPASVPILTTLSTSPDARHLLRHLSSGVKELLRTRSRSLVEYEEGEYGIGREGITECRERLETLADGYAGGIEEEEDGMGEKDEDENWEATEQQEDSDGLFDD